jgi:glycosyltransferase involved in cell wall biosynthesis
MTANKLSKCEAYMRPLVSILINNFNYCKYLPEAIDSALSQTYAPTEVIVVDDGSTDQSRRVIARYHSKIVSILKENGGQASAFNVAVSRSKGGILCFLDSDDWFYPTKVEEVVAIFTRADFESRPIMVHHPVEISDEIAGKATGQTFGKTHSSPCNCYDFARKYHFVEYIAGPTTGISLNRRLAQLLFPLPERTARTSADDFIVKASSLLSTVYSMDKRLACYRLHGKNAWFYSDRRHSEEFYRELDCYLNDKLRENNLSAVMARYDSMDCWADLVLGQRWRELARHVGKQVLLHPDRYTSKYLYNTTKLALRELKRTLGGRQSSDFNSTGFEKK